MSAIFEKLLQVVGNGSTADVRLAQYFIDHFTELPFETAASIAEKNRLSPMTVSRFLRRLGFQGLDAVKAEMRSEKMSSAWEVNDDVNVLRKDLQEGRLLAELMAEHINALHRLYDLSQKEEWFHAVESILNAQEIFVASYQNIGGIARYFTEQLLYARGGVRYMDGLNGTYVELLGHPPKGTLLILIDTRRFASKSRALAEAATKAGIQVLLVTDQYCLWANTFGTLNLILPPTLHRTWDSFMSLAALLDFLVTSVVVASGDKAKERTDQLLAMQNQFGDFAKR